MSKTLVIIGGGIAAYKALEVIRLLRAKGDAVHGLLTTGGARFITPLSVAALSGQSAPDSVMDHIALARWADRIVVAPATANLLARMAAGMADELATTVLLASEACVYVAPAMNPAMWAHPATRANVETLRQRGVAFIGPCVGDVACGEAGEGRMAEPLDIINALNGPRPLAGRRALITSGPTWEALDPVRFIANRSSGRQGHAIAAALARAGAEVVLVSGPVALPDPCGVHVIRVETAREMLEACMAALPCDIFVGAAAVADWSPQKAAQKIKKGPNGPPKIILEENPDIVAHIANVKENRPSLVIGFAAETENLLENAEAKLHKKGCDWIVANAAVFDGADNQVYVLDAAGQEAWPRMSKTAVAEKLTERIGKALNA